MILEQKKTHLSYRCPACLGMTSGYLLPFAATDNNRLRMKCPCGGSEMFIHMLPDRRVRLSVPCVFCGQEHQYPMNRSLFFGRELFALNCPATNVDICFIGEEEQVARATESNTADLNELIEALREESGEDPLAPPAPVLPEAQVYDILRFLVKELEAEGAVSCPCMSGSYELELVEAGVRVYCESCGASYLFPAGTVSEAQAFLHTESLALE